MKRLILLYLVMISALGTIAQPTATSVGMVDFAVHGNLNNNERNGTTDVSTKLENAINHAINQSKTLFIPSGTYRVSKSFILTGKTGSHNGQQSVVIVGDKFNPPLIKLADNSNGFQNGSSDVANGPRAVFTLKPDQWPNRKSDWMYYCGVRGINFDLGSGNSGAIAISWPSAQHCFIEDIEINAQGAWAGIAGLPGANALIVNVKVFGGKFGIYGSRNEDTQTIFGHAATNNLVGCVLHNQTQNALNLYGWGGVTLVGMDIQKSGGTAIRINGSSNSHSCPLSLVDCKIEFTGSSSGTRAIDNAGRSTIGLRDVYTRNAEVISHNNNDQNHTFQGSVGNWTYTTRYSYVTSKSTGGEGRHHINGNSQSNAIVEKSNASPPVDLISRHIYPFTPSFQDADVHVIDNSGDNHRQKIQNAINSHAKVMLAAGDYFIDGPIELKSNTILFGVPGPHSNLINASTWNPGTKVWMIHTENSGGASTYLMDIGTRPTRSNSFFGGAHWRAGRNSIVRNCSFGRYYGTPSEVDVQRVFISDNGGGRWYNYQDHKQYDNGGSTNNNHRKVLVSGTSQPLSFYGLNLERGGASAGEVNSYPMLEILNSSNVRVFGAKSETYQPYAKIINSNNIFLTNIQDWCIHKKGQMQQDYIHIENSASDNIEILCSQWNHPPNNTFKIVRDPWSTTTPNRAQHMGLYRKGAVDMESFNEPPAAQFLLTVNSGSGSGNYAEGTLVNIVANTPPSGQIFDKWTGEVAVVENVNLPNTTLTMPADSIIITATYKTAVRSPYVTQSLPGLIEAEFYDNGGQGIAYNDDGVRNGDGTFRPLEFVDVVAKATASNGHSIGYGNSGEWVEYTLENVETGLYEISLRYASGSSSRGDLEISLDGVTITTITGLNNTGGWNTFATATVSNVALNGGANKILRFEYVNGADFDIDYVEFVAIGRSPYTTLNIPGLIECEFYDNGGQGVAYNDDGVRNGDGTFRPLEFVDVVAKATASNGHSIGYSNSGEWVEYTLENVVSGNYAINLSYASGAPSRGDLRVSLDGVVLTTITGLNNTGGWNTFITTTVNNISVSGGANSIMRLEYVNGADFDIDYIEFVPEVQNLLMNGEFDNGTSGWTSNFQQGASGNFSVVTNAAMSGPNAARISISNGGSSNWHIEFFAFFSLESAKTYEISFQAKAQSSRSALVALQRNSSPWTHYWEQNFNIGTGTQTYTYTWTSNINDANTRINFKLGNSSADVWIDKVSIKEVSSGSRLGFNETLDFELNDNSTLNSEVSIYPNPTGRHMFFVNISNANRHENYLIRMMDSSGKTISSHEIKGENDLVHGINCESLNSGVYLIHVNSNLINKTMKVVIQ
ncbi:MAG: carbohydrate-binding protein [Cyclobacteriaceae bacterium]